MDHVSGSGISVTCIDGSDNIGVIVVIVFVVSKIRVIIIIECVGCCRCIFIYLFSFICYGLYTIL